MIIGRALLTLGCCLAVLINLLSQGLADDPIGVDEGVPRVPWTDARRAIGRVALVHGRIVTVEHTQRIHFLDFHESDRAAFKAVLFDGAMKGFPQGIDHYHGQLVEIRGLVSTYNNNPQIIVGRPSQIRILDSAPAIYWPPPVKRVAVGNQIRIASFNVENLFDNADDPYRNDETSLAKPRTQLEHLAEILRAVNADVLALQEVESRGYLERFLEVLIPDVGYEHIVHYEGNDERGIDVCLLSRVPVGPVVSYRHLRFQDAAGNWRRFQRDLLRVKLEPIAGKPFEAWVVHLKSNYGGRQAAEPIRLAEANKIRELVDHELAVNPNAQFVICGDFNDTFDSLTLRTIRGTLTGKQLACFCNELSEDKRITYNKEPYREMIDFILCSPKLGQRYVSSSYQIVDATGASDHNVVSLVIGH